MKKFLTLTLTLTLTTTLVLVSISTSSVFAGTPGEVQTSCEAVSQSSQQVKSQSIAPATQSGQEDGQI